MALWHGLNGAGRSLSLSLSLSTGTRKGSGPPPSARERAPANHGASFLSLTMEGSAVERSSPHCGKDVPIGRTVRAEQASAHNPKTN